MQNKNTRKKPPETESSISVRLTQDESDRLEWVAAKLGYRGISAMLRTLGLEKELELRNLEQK